MDAASTSSLSSSGRRKRHHAGGDGSSSKKRSKQQNANGDAAHGRRDSLSAPARDPRDIPEKPKKKSSTKKSAKQSTSSSNNNNTKAAAAAVVATPTPTTGTTTRSPTPVVDFDGLSRPTVGTRERLEESKEQADKRLARMTGAVRTILECVGEDADREGLLATPERYAKAMLFFTKGYQQNVRDIVNGAIFEEGHNEMVIVKDIEVFSMCEHHLVPFTGKMHIGYIPNQSVIGISKLPRIAEMFARRLQIQERLTKEVANAIMEVLKPQGVAVVMESSHLCMVMRGVEKTSTSTITSCVLGCFERKEKTRNEFLNLISVNRR
ncbi:hypothetical protein VSDG_07821 [Cytospora chrysosperma]|uniref:GTP cyclohydrolase 1 n=1 Tax=Cytospora chrysosperma TaxID=252740 RepID=A0A423VJF0_CYTCH|nr:hypothetical protein VSDG_07821 [Valsa sordida]